MNLSKSFEFFNPESCQEDIHIIGCGSVGSTVAELLARFGLTNFNLYDFDVVEEHNLVNQMFTTEDLYHPKAEMVARHLISINPEIKDHLVLYSEGWDGHMLSGYVFLCVDSIELRKRIVTENKFNGNIKAVFDFRTGLTEAQHYAADWSRMEDKNALLNTMNFTDAEANQAVPMSACHVSLCVAPTVRLVSLVGVTNFINFVKGGTLNKVVLTDAFTPMVEVL